MIGFCSSQGVYNQAGEIVSELFPNEAQARVEELEADEDYNSGTVRFLRGAVKACRSGVRRCHLISYQENGALLQELFSRDGIGTQIVMESAEQIRRATINDIGGILELISPLEQQGILVRRSREQLEMEIDKFTIIQRDNTTIACAALYPFPEEKIGEMACVAVHPDYRSSSRGEVLLERIAAQARQMGLSKLFVLTTRSIHWFQERGFTPVDIDLLPESKKQMYNYQQPVEGADGRPRLSPSPLYLTARDSATLIALSPVGLPPLFPPAWRTHAGEIPGFRAGHFFLAGSPICYWLSTGRRLAPRPPPAL